MRELAPSKGRLSCGPHVSVSSYTSNVKAVANMILANAPIAPGPLLLPLTILAPMRRPMAAPLA
jgi:hypothetical protein